MLKKCKGSLVSFRMDSHISLEEIRPSCCWRAMTGMFSFRAKEGVCLAWVQLSSCRRRHHTGCRYVKPMLANITLNTRDTASQ